MDLAKILSYGVSSWLHFETACNRSGLFNEKYLTAPVGQILSARSGNRTEAEWKHPVLSNTGQGPGRRPEVDFYVKGRADELPIAVETKWAGRTLPSTKDILWDLIRLELIAHHNQARCFFLLAGKKERLDQIFDRKDFTDANSPTMKRPLLRIDNNIIHATSLVPTVSSRIPILRSLFEKMQDFEFPHKLHTRRTAPSPENPKRKHYQVYIWEVKSATNRQIFRPSNSKHYTQSQHLNTIVVSEK